MMTAINGGKLPPWLSIEVKDRDAYLSMLGLLKSSGLHTICIEGDCPNRYECFARGQATFLILGDVCTRNCSYCNVKTGIPGAVDYDEIRRIGTVVRESKIGYAVITSVTRDDLEDGGASVFALAIREVKRAGSRVEVLIPDFRGDENALNKVIDARPDVIAHNIETTRRVFKRVRGRADYSQSLNILSYLSRKRCMVKSGLMLGLGESIDEIKDTLRELREAGVDIVTIGQYLAPGRGRAAVMKYYSAEEFRKIGDYAYSLGFGYVASSPLVRSSYRAEEAFLVAFKRKNGRESFQTG